MVFETKSQLRADVVSIGSPIRPSGSRIHPAPSPLCCCTSYTGNAGAIHKWKSLVCLPPWRAKTYAGLPQPPMHNYCHLMNKT
eukprot:scaffold5761_cov16-Prasinocladus_malaysianus.AAC.1